MPATEVNPMSSKTTADIFTAGTLVQVNGAALPGVGDIGGVGGSSSEYDITSLSDEAIVSKAGLHDAGSITISGVAVPHTPTFKTVRDANQNSSSIALKITVGGRPAGAGLTDGSARVVQADRTMTVALEQSRAVFTDADNATLAGVVTGDFLEYLTGNAPGSTQTQEITAAVVSGASAKFTTALTTAPTLTSNSKVKILRPAMQFSGSATVTQVELSVPTNDAMRYSITFRVTGKLTTTIGTPTITV